MFESLRPVRFAEVDAAQIVFFARYLEYCHDALEAFFGALEGGYPHMINVRDLGIPSVHAEIDWRAPLRYGDTARIEVRVAQIGTRSATFVHRLYRLGDNVLAAEVKQTVVFCHLRALGSVVIPGDVRALLEAHLEAPKG